MNHPIPHPGPDHYYIGWSDIKVMPQGQLPPWGYKPLIPGYNAYVPDPAANQTHLGFFPPNQMPKDPIDLSTLQHLPPGQLGEYPKRELIPGTGLWATDTRGPSYPGQGPYQAKAPLDISQLKYLGPGELGPRGYSELVPGSGVWAPDPTLGNDTPHAQHSGLHKDDGAGPDGQGDKPFKAEMAELEKFAKEHDLNAQQVLDWARKDPDFAEQYLQTHGKVNYATYLKIKDFQQNKVIAGTAFADQQTHTANALRNTVYITQTNDEAGAAGVRNAVTEI